MNLQEEIAKVAHELFEKDGRRHGRDLEHWIAAEKIVKARYAKQDKAVEKVTPKAVVVKKEEPKKAGPKKAEPRKTESGAVKAKKKKA